MKDYTKKQLQSSRPDKSSLECVEFCLKQLFKDKTKLLGDEIVDKLTYEELIGTLLLCQDELTI